MGDVAGRSAVVRRSPTGHVRSTDLGAAPDLRRRGRPLANLVLDPRAGTDEDRSRVSHPDPNGPPDLRPVRFGEVWENPVTGERATILELPYTNPERRAAAELTAPFGTRLPAEHRHPSLVECITVLEGELTVKLDGQASTLGRAETVVIEPNVWHDWWNPIDYDTRVRIEITPGDRFAHMIETLFGLARLGHSRAKGTPHPLQLALIDKHF